MSFQRYFSKGQIYKGKWDAINILLKGLSTKRCQKTRTESINDNEPEGERCHASTECWSSFYLNTLIFLRNTCIWNIQNDYCTVFPNALKIRVRRKYQIVSKGKHKTHKWWYSTLIILWLHSDDSTYSATMKIMS